MTTTAEEIVKRKDFYSNLQSCNNLVDWLRAKGLLAIFQVCDNCNVQMKERKEKTNDGLRWRCNTSRCKKRELSIRYGSFFEGSHLNCETILTILYEWNRNSKICDVVLDTGVSKKGIIDWFGFIRKVIVGEVDEENNLIGGAGLTVEIDETVIVRRK